LHRNTCGLGDASDRGVGVALVEQLPVGRIEDATLIHECLLGAVAVVVRTTALDILRHLDLISSID
jgi:hypothetical protein